MCYIDSFGGTPFLRLNNVCAVSLQPFVKHAALPCCVPHVNTSGGMLASHASYPVPASFIVKHLQEGVGVVQT